MSVINWLKAKYYSFRAGPGITVQEGKDDDVDPKVLLIDTECFYILKVLDGRQIPDENILNRKIKFLEDCREHWEDFTKGMSDFDKRDISGTVAYFLSDYYKYSNKMKPELQAEVIRKELEERSGAKPWIILNKDVLLDYWHNGSDMKFQSIKARLRKV
jgi:hypothetical protein